MTNVKAIVIAKSIRSGDYSREEKLAAIVKIRDMPTLNSIYKDELLEIIRFLFNELPMSTVLSARKFLQQETAEESESIKMPRRAGTRPGRP